MALFATHKKIKFGVGDLIKVTQKVKEGGKVRTQVFEGMVIGIKGRDEGKTFTVRRIGVQQIGIEKIFPLRLPSIQRIEIVKKGSLGIRRAKLYYTRDKSKKEIDKIYSRAAKRQENSAAKAKK